jgi:fructokinase
MKKQVLCFGEVLWDAFGDGKKAGGAPMNVARHLVQQGVNTVFASSVGTDPSGEELTDFLKNNGLFNAALLQRDENLPTCEVTIALDEHKQATYVFPPKVSWDNIQFTGELGRAAEKADAIVFGSLASRQRKTFETLLGVLEVAKGLKIFDVNLRPPHYELNTIETLVARANVVKMNEDEAALLIHGGNGSLKQKITEFQKKFHTQIICVTRGENGAIVWRDFEFYEHPGCKVQVVDTVGAGDSFLATFIAGLLNGDEMNSILAKACAIGAFVAGKRGATPEYDLKEIGALMK